MMNLRRARGCAAATETTETYQAMTEFPGYPLSEKYRQIVDKIRMCAPPGLTQVWGTCEYDAIPDFRLKLGPYRVIGTSPLPRRVAVFMEWRKVFRNRGTYENNPDFDIFKDAFGYLRINENLNPPWNVDADTDLDDRYVEAFLEAGMRLIATELRRTPPQLR